MGDGMPANGRILIDRERRKRENSTLEKIAKRIEREAKGCAPDRHNHYLDAANIVRSMKE